MDYAQAVKCAILSQEIYQDFSDQLRFSGFPNSKPELICQKTTETQYAIVAEDPAGTSIYIAFQGSEQQMDWETNLDFKQEAIELKQEVIQGQIVQSQAQVYPYKGESSSGVKMHEGFAKAFMSVRDQLHTYVANHPVTKVTVTGHSLGGALATLCALDLQYNFSDKVTIALYTFGSPRVGNGAFRTSFNQRVPDSSRFVYGMDIVPALPRPWQGYSHVDAEFRMGSRFSWNFFSQRFKDHAIANYVAALQILVKNG